MPREFQFPASVTWEGGRRTSACVEGKPAIGIAPPPEFRGTDPDTWSPEDFFTTAAASCLADASSMRWLAINPLAVASSSVIGIESGVCACATVANKSAKQM